MERTVMITRRSIGAGLLATLLCLNPRFPLAQQSLRSNPSDDKSERVHQFYLVGNIDPDMFKSIINSVYQFMRAKTDRIVIVINSTGGDVSSAFAIYRFLRGLPVPITTINIDSVESAANIVFLAGHRRVAVPDSNFFMHDITYNRDFKTEEDIKQRYDQMKILYNIYVKIFSENTKVSKEETREIMRSGTFINAEKALEIGMVHSIEGFTFEDLPE